MKTKIFALLLLFFPFTFIHAQTPTEMWGMTYRGGDGFGTIFKTDSAGENLVSTDAFRTSTSGRFAYYSKLTQVGNGKMYGIMDGGIYDDGVLYEYDPSTGIYTKKLDFTDAVGKNPVGSLVLGSNGKLYGMTEQGGTANLGTVYEYVPSTNAITRKISFTGVTNGSTPEGSLMLAADGKLYGMTYAGGISNNGVLFQYTTSTNTLVKKINFDGVAKGANPYGDLVQAPNGKLYGMTSSGGATSYGVIFDYNIINNVFVKRMEFNGLGNGMFPMGGFKLGTDGILYGMAVRGGTNDLGTLFEYDPIGNTFTKDHDFDSLGGNYPKGNLVQASNGLLYGFGSEGGTDNVGTIFSYDPVNNIYLKKVDMNTVTTGAYPSGTMIVGQDGKLYGLVSGGGAHGYGVLFDYDIASEDYVNEIQFDGATNGQNPTGTLIEASNGKLYATSKFGGYNDLGALFEIDPSINEGKFVKKADFDGTTTGHYPVGSLVQAPNGKLYGECAAGGANDKGVLFEYDLSTNVITDKIDFNGSGNGNSPNGNLILGSNGKLYGTTLSGGANNRGVLFEYDPATNTLVNKFDFSLPLTPGGSVIQASNGKLYGLGGAGGSLNRGVIFEYDLAASTYAIKYNFGAAYNDGIQPVGSLLEAPNGKFYGVSPSGGTDSAGVIFEYDLSTNTYTKKIDFIRGITGASFPQTGMMLAANGMMYGMSRNGGAIDRGTLYQYDYVNNIFTKKEDFIITNGASPFSNILLETCKSVYVTPQPSMIALCENATLSINSGATNGNYTFQWFFNDTAITGATSSVYTVNNVALSDSGWYYCRISNACRSANTDSVQVLIHPVQINPPVTPGTITGPNNACPFIGATTNATYSISAVSGNPSYNWTVPAGATILSGQGTTSITVKYTSSFAPGNVAVQSVLTCGGSSSFSTLAVSKIITGNLGTIYGYRQNLCTATNYTYYVNPLPAATSYVWTIPSGCTFVSGQGTNSIVVTYSTAFVSGSLSVKAVNQCSASAIVSASITKKPVAPTAISGMKNVCAFVGTGMTTYSITAVPNISSYLWTVPANASIISGQGTTSISVSFSSSFTSGNITVASVGICVNSNPTSITVTYAPPMPGVITGTTHICSEITSATPITYSIAAVSGATSYNWTVPTGGTILSGAGTTTVSILFDSTTVTGSMLKVVAVNGCTVSSIRSITLTACAGSRIENPIDSSVQTTIASDLYPVPTTDFFSIKITVDADKEILIAVFDVTGKEMIEERHDVVSGENTFSTNVSSLASGMYFVQVIDLTNNTAEIRKLIKE